MIPISYASSPSTTKVTTRFGVFGSMPPLVRKVLIKCSKRNEEDDGTKASSSKEQDSKKQPNQEQRQQASNIIVSALGDHALRVVRSVIGDPVQMMAKLDDRYDSKTIATRISKMSELVSLKYTSLRDDVGKHIDKLAGIIEQLRSMGTNFDDSLAIGILVASIEVPELGPATAAIKTLADKDVKWEDVCARLIDESKTMKSGSRHRSNLATNRCGICNKTNHTTDKCFLNPLNPSNKLRLKVKPNVPITTNEVDSEAKKDEEDQKQNKKKKKPKARSAMALIGGQSDRTVDRMMLDSGTTSHLTSYVDRVEQAKTANIPITLADDSKMTATARGIREVQWKTEEGDNRIRLSNTLVVPNLSMSLLSIPSLVNKNIAVLFLPGKAVLIDLEDNFAVLGYATQEEDGLFYIDDFQKTVPKSDNLTLQIDKAMMAAVKKQAHIEKPKVKGEGKIKRETEIWHRRLGHVKSTKEIKRLVQDDQLPHPKCTTIDCEPCAKGKFRRQFKGSLTNSKEIGRLHVDTKGKVDTPSVNGHLYFLTIVEEHSRYTMTYPMKSKGEASELLINFVTRFERQSGKVIKKVHGDNGSEFSRAYESLSKKGVDITTSTVYTLESNGLVERTHSVLLSSVRSCIIQAKLPKSYWNYALRHVTDCRNVLPHSGTNKIPYEVVFGHQSNDVHHIRPFGCRVEFLPTTKKISPFSPRTDTGINLFHEGGGIYRIDTKDKHVRTKHVNFIENEFPGSISNLDTEDESSSSSDSDSGSDLTVNTWTDTEYDEYEDDSHSEGEEDQESNSEVDSEKDESDESESDDEDEVDSEQENDSIEESDEEDHESKDGDEDQTDEINPDDLTYIPSEPSKFGITPEQSDNDEEEIDGTHKRDQSGHNLRPQQRKDYSMAALPDAITTDDEPKIREALSSADRKHWILAIDEELESLTKNGTWKEGIVPPVSVKVLPSMIILKLKRDENGRPARFKGRLVALGNMQSDLTLLMDLYAPVICIELVRALLSVAQVKGWAIRQIDFKGAFLNAYLDKGEEIWIKLPDIPGTKFVGQIVKLIKSLYGLRQSPKLWYEYLYNRLRKLGFKRSSASDSLFLLVSSQSIVILVYVDDILIMGNDTDIEEMVVKLRKLFEITDLGRPSHFLGVKMEFRAEGIFLSQSAYIQKIVQMANLVEAKPTKYPLPMAHPLYDEAVEPSPEDISKMENIPFRKVLGALLYLSTRTRPDIATAVSMIAKFQSKPTLTHWKLLKNVVRYLIGTKDYGILLPKGNDGLEVLCWTDADWARDLSNRRSRTGILITLNGGPIVWTSKLQTSTALSTPEAEFNALSHSIKELRWLRIVLLELKAIDTGPIIIKQDNLGSISWTEGVNGLRKVKHVGIKYHYVRDSVERKIVQVGYTPSAENRSDSLTKVMIGEEFIKHRSWLGVCL